MANALHNRLLQTIAADDAARLQDETPAAPHGANIPTEEHWWDHLITHFFQRDETSLFVDLRIDRGVFNVLLNAIEDLPLQTRGRRSFIHSHREQLLFRCVHMASGRMYSHFWSVQASRLSPNSTGTSRRIAFLYGRSLKVLSFSTATGPRDLPAARNNMHVPFNNPTTPISLLDKGERIEKLQLTTRPSSKVF